MPVMPIWLIKRNRVHVCRQRSARGVVARAKLIDQVWIDGVVVGHRQAAVLLRLGDTAQQRRQAGGAEAGAVRLRRRVDRAVLPGEPPIDRLVRRDVLVDANVELIARNRRRKIYRIVILE